MNNVEIFDVYNVGADLRVCPNVGVCPKAESLVINSVGQRPTTNRNVHKTEPCKGAINNNH